VRDLLLTLAVAVVLGLVVFGAVAFTLGKASGLDPASPDAAPHDLPQDGPVEAADLSAVRFDVVPRGYRMDQVDGVLERLGYELRVRDEEIRALRADVRLLHADGGEPTGAHAARPDPDEAGEVPVSPDQAPRAPADDDTAILGDSDLVEDQPVEEGPAADRAVASDDTAVLGDLMGNERHPR
jgi:DivIVA domain-containing protein